MFSFLRKLFRKTHKNDDVKQKIDEIKRAALDHNNPMPYLETMEFLGKINAELRSTPPEGSFKPLTHAAILNACSTYIQKHSKHCSAILAKKPENSGLAEERKDGNGSATPSKS